MFFEPFDQGNGSFGSELVARGVQGKFRHGIPRKIHIHIHTG